MDEDDDMEDFMDHLSQAQFKDMFKGLGKGYRMTGHVKPVPKGRAANAKASKNLASSGLKKQDQKYLDKMMEDLVMGQMASGNFDMAGGMPDEETMMHMMMGGGDPSQMFASMPGMKKQSNH
jgi:hypothetical protein